MILELSIVLLLEVIVAAVVVADALYPSREQDSETELRKAHAKAGLYDFLFPSA